MKTKKHKMMKHRTKKHKKRKRKARKYRNKKKILKQKGGRIDLNLMLLPLREFTDQELFLDELGSPIEEANNRFREYYNKFSQLSERFRQQVSDNSDYQSSFRMIAEIFAEGPNRGINLSLNLYNLNIRNITPLSYLTNLRQLSLEENNVHDISPLRNTPLLTLLNLGSNYIEDINILSELVYLQQLNLEENSIEDITSLRELNSLILLKLNGNMISNITPLSQLVNIESLNLSENSIQNIEPLAELINLKVLMLNNNAFINDLTPLQNMTFLKTLMIEYDHNDISVYNGIRDITPLSGLTNLMFLNLRYNIINDITPLSQLTNMKILILSALSQELYSETENPPTPITDITPLRNMTGLFELHLNNNNISDVTALRNLNNLMVLELENNNVESIVPIFGLLENNIQSFNFRNNNLNQASLNFLNADSNQRRIMADNVSDAETESMQAPTLMSTINSITNQRLREIRLQELDETIQQAKAYEIDISVADKSVKVFDLISMENTSISQLLNDADNIIFQSDTPPFNASVVTIEQLQNLVYNPTYLNQTKYQCHNLSEGLAFTNEDIVIPSLNEITLERDKYKFINTRSIGMPGGLFLRSQLKDILTDLVRNRLSTKHFIYHIHTDKSIKPIIAADKIRWNYKPSDWTMYAMPPWSAGLSEAHDSSEDAFNMVSADHCQSNDDNFIITFTPAVRRSKRGKYVDYNEGTRKKRKTQKAGRKKASKKTRQRKKRIKRK